MSIELKHSIFKGIINASPSKSHEQRLLAAALLSEKGIILGNIGNSNDVLAARDILISLGRECRIDADNKLVCKKQDSFESAKRTMILNCKESALCARLFAPIVCVFGIPFTITGTGTLLKRKVANDFEILKKMGCEFESENGNLPVRFTKSVLKSGKYSINNTDTSQFVSGLIFSLPLLKEDSQIFITAPVSINYILLTVKVLEDFGVLIKFSFDNDGTMMIDIPGNQTYQPKRIYTVEGDWSGIANFCVAAAVNGKIGVKGLLKNSLQPDIDILKVFDFAGVHYYWDKDILIVEKSQIKAFDFNAVNCPDLIPAITVLAAFANGESHIYGACRLKSKESSRAEVLQNELSKANVNINVEDDLIQIIGNGIYNFAEFDSHDDHRIAMALTVFGMLSENGARLKNYNCVSKSYPDFYNDINRIANGSSIEV